MVRTCDEGKYTKDHAATMLRTYDEVPRAILTDLQRGSIRY